MRGAAADHRADADHRVVVPGQIGRDDGQLDGSGDPQHDRIVDPAGDRGGGGPFDQGVGDVGVPAGTEDGQGEFGGVDRIQHGAPLAAHADSMIGPAPDDLFGPAAGPFGIGRFSIVCPSRSRLAAR